MAATKEAAAKKTASTPASKQSDSKPASSKTEYKPNDLVEVRLSSKHPTQVVPFRRLKLMGKAWQIVGRAES